MSRRKDRERAEAGIIYRNGLPVSASAWERQRQSAIADMEAAAKKGIQELAGAFGVLGHALGMGVTATQRRGFWDKARKGDKDETKK